jgi:hypothetical protein
MSPDTFQMRMTFATQDMAKTPLIQDASLFVRSNSRDQLTSWMEDTGTRLIDIELYRAFTGPIGR